MRSVWSYERRCAASESTSFAVLMRWKRSAASGALFLSGWYLPERAARREREAARPPAQPRQREHLAPLKKYKFSLARLFGLKQFEVTLN